ncbi:alpha kinase/elongation factor 2 kinase [Anaeramoeba flamelloides]|uniref:Alpha kinase/elongation factor 2 kinase n=1 Tax=Anaeramoeba flamelloides TaxID=1746091 RepID=A0AAV7ZDV1_9EUKA|nr:alpha kinase/elongation factor 2 kinase [Anaeramoeba flamelloides]
MSLQRNYKIVCAIDFGTSRTGASWSTTHNENWQVVSSDFIKIYLDPEDQNFKTSTAILFKKKTNSNKWKPISFGKKAETEYLLFQNNQTRNYQFFKNFKMKLYQNDSKNLKIQFYSGVQWKFIKVLSGLFKFIFKKFIKSYQVTYQGMNKDIDLNTIPLVLTVPAIWENQAKEIMRRAFHQAGLISSKNSLNLIFCYEPEAAAIDYFYDHTNKTDFNNKKLLVVDAGGGTIDITLMKPTIVKNKIEEFEILMIPKGGDFGSIYIDQEFQKFFQSFLNLNDNQFNTLKNTCPKGFLKLLNQWSQIKREIQIEEMTVNDSHVIEIPRIMVKYLSKKLQIKDFEALTDQFNQRNHNSGLSEIECDDEGCLIIYGDRIKSFFKKPIQRLRNYLNNLKQTSEIFKQTEIVFFTGGLSNSDYFRESVQKQLGNNYQYILSTYPDKKIIIKNGNNQEIEHCQNVFQPYIFKEDPIKLSDPKKAIFTPIKKNLKEMKIYILRTDQKWDPNNNSIYLDSQDVQIMGAITLPIPQSNLALNEQKFEVSFHFATTEIKIFMKYLPDPTIKKQLTLNYDDIQIHNVFKKKLPFQNPNLHVFLILDTSGSMESEDVQPSNNQDWFQQNQFPNNRYGAVLEAVGEYIIERKKISTNDRMTLIHFDKEARLVFKDKELSTKLVLNSRRPLYGKDTIFVNGLKLAIQVLNDTNLQGRIPKMIIFSDGQDWGNKNKLLTFFKCYLNSQLTDKGLTIDAVLLGPKEHKLYMDEISKIGKGTSHQVIDLEGLVNSFIQLAHN